MLNPKQFHSRFIAWMNDCHSANHMVCAFCAANEVVIGQVKTAEKSNEITAIPELLKLLNINGCLFSIDAMGCQKKIATEILNGNGDYLLEVKGNQKRLEQAFDDIFDLCDLQNENENTYGTQ